jgi:tRNA (guanine-N7-)-methyltransferase
MIRHALSYPETNILGIEVRESLTEYINGVVSGESIPNAHAEWYTLANGLDWIEPESIAYAVYLFPDPWPKKRHHKRRAFGHEFLAMLHRLLKPGGRLWLATDREDVDAYQREVLSESALFRVSPLLTDETWPFDFATDQQMFCRSKNIPYVRYFAEKL